MGRVGSGKSTLASALGRELGWDIFSSDQARKELAGLPLYTRGGPAVRRRLYSKATTRKTYAAFAECQKPSQGAAQSDPRRHLQPSSLPGSAEAAIGQGLGGLLLCRGSSV